MSTEPVVYVAWRTEQTAFVRKICEGKFLSLNYCFHLRNHSPTGFEWGYRGSGPAQLALALCADMLASEEQALDCYQLFKARSIGRLAERGWVRYELDFQEIIEEIYSQEMPLLAPPVFKRKQSLKVFEQQ